MTDTTAPVTIPAPYRPALIAAVHAAAIFLAEEPRLQIPTNVTMDAYVATMGELLEAAADHQVGLNQGGEWSWIIIPVCVEALHGLTIDYRLFCKTPRTNIEAAGSELPARDAGITHDAWRDRY